MKARPKDIEGKSTLADRLWSRVVITASGCWEWAGGRTSSGYGQVSRGARAEGKVTAHRAAWEVTHGPIPDGMVVRHRCDNQLCCNPAHLELGSDQQNSDDKVSRGRQARGDALPHTKLTDEQVREIRRRYVKSFGPPKRGGRRSNADELAAEYGVGRCYVMNLVHRHERAGVA